MKYAFGFFLTCILLVMFVKIHDNYLRSDVFLLKDIQIEGDIDIVSKELENEKEFLMGKSIWDIDTNRMEAVLEEDIRIKTATVSKSIPDELNIKIKSHHPEYYILFKGNIFSLNEDKNIFAYLNEFPKQDYPILSIKEENEITRLTEVLDKYKGSQLESLTSELYVENQNCVNLVLLDGTIIKTQEDVPKGKYIIVERLYLKLLASKTPLKYIDIRFGDYIVK